MYSKGIQSVLKKIKTGDRILLKSKKGTFEGILMPRPEIGDTNCVVLKLDSGYNIGIRCDKKLEVKLVKKADKPKTKKAIKEKRGEIAILGCGGTIASKIEYKTGAVFPALSGKELVKSYPEINEVATIHTKNLFSVFSEDMTPNYWVEIAKEVEKQIKGGAQGVIITHGTDTMHYTSAALSFMLQNLPIPIILTGAQRSSDRGSSDAKLNLLSSILAAKSDLGEVGICMHGNVNDIIAYVHRGTRVRKMHTSRRDAFQSIGHLPLMRIEWKDKRIDEITPYRKRTQGKPKVGAKVNENVALIQTHPGIKPKFIDSLSDYDGIVLAGSGLGHASTNPFDDKKAKPVLKNLEELVKSGIPVVMAPQTIYGRLNMNVYTAGRLLREIGVIGHGCDWTPECAFAKLCWVLGKTKKMKEVEKLMTTNIVGEITEKSDIL